MARLHDWPERLAAVIGANMARPFAWGEWDCVHFSAACVKAMTGVDHIPTDCAPYDTKRSAKRQIIRYGRDMAAICDRKFGARIALALARRGDLVQLDGALGIVCDADALFVAAAGLERRPVATCQRSWRIE